MNKNLINNNLKILKKKFVLLKKDINFEFKKQTLKEMKIKLISQYSWKNKKHAIKLKKKIFLLTNIINKIVDINNELIEISTIFELINEYYDNELFEEGLVQLKIIEKKINDIEYFINLNGEFDHCNCYIDIQSGSGGTDAQDWSSILMKMYLKWSEIKKFKIQIIYESLGEIAGIKSATLYIMGNYAYGLLKNETGIHRLVRKSPFDSSNRRHTSFSSIFVYPEIDEKENNIIINNSDLRIDVYRASGAGGQHVNRTESAVRITHIPTNIVVQCQKHRSQHKNKEQAIKQIKAKLYEFNMHIKKIEQDKIEKNKPEICWGRQIRSYIIDHSIIKDLRSGLEQNNIQEILNGKIDPFIKANLKMHNLNKF